MLNPVKLIVNLVHFLALGEVIVLPFTCWMWEWDEFLWQGRRVKARGRVEIGGGGCWGKLDWPCLWSSRDNLISWEIVCLSCETVESFSKWNWAHEITTELRFTDSIDRLLNCCIVNKMDDGIRFSYIAAKTYFWVDATKFQARGEMYWRQKRSY